MGDAASPAAGLNEHLHTFCPINGERNPPVCFSGRLLCEEICLEELCVSGGVSEALTEGLAALSTQQEVRFTVNLKHKNIRKVRGSKLKCALSSSDQTSGVSRQLPDEMARAGGERGERR